MKAQADLIELKEPDINGFLYILTITTDKGIKAAGGSKTKTAKELHKVMLTAIPYRRV